MTNFSLTSQGNSADNPLLFQSELPASDEVYRDLVPAFIQRLNDNAIRLQTLLAGQSWTDLKVLAHQLKGAGGGYGFQILTEKAGALEKIVGDESPDSQVAEKLINEIAQIAQGAGLGLDAWLQGAKP